MSLVVVVKTTREAGRPARCDLYLENCSFCSMKTSSKNFRAFFSRKSSFDRREKVEIADADAVCLVGCRFVCLFSKSPRESLSRVAHADDLFSSFPDCHFLSLSSNPMVHVLFNPFLLSARHLIVHRNQSDSKWCYPVESNPLEVDVN